MPEFFAEHTPPGLSDFERGYFEAAEWLANGFGPKYESSNDLDREDRAKLRGFTHEAVARGKRDCAVFVEANGPDLETYEQVRGKDLSYAGHDFWLSRNGHGAGFFDRGDDDCFNRLQTAAGRFCEVNCESYRNRLVFS